MKTLCTLIATLSFVLSFAQTTLPEAALNEVFLTQDSSEITLGQILENERGKFVFIDIWSSWCGSCFIKMSEVKKLQKIHPEVTYIFLSVEGSFSRWNKTLKKLTVTGQHYFVPSYLHGDFAKSINLKQIPRYLVINPSGKLVSLDASNFSINQINTLLNEN